MTKWHISTEVPAVVSLRLQVEAVTEAEAKKRAKLYIKRTWGEHHHQEADNIPCNEMPDLDVVSVDWKRAKLEAQNFDDCPVLYIDTKTGEMKKAGNYKEFLAMRQKEGW